MVNSFLATDIDGLALIKTNKIMHGRRLNEPAHESMVLIA